MNDQSLTQGNTSPISLVPSKQKELNASWAENIYRKNSVYEYLKTESVESVYDIKKYCGKFLKRRKETLTNPS